ncbi:MAG TPA: RIO1 family regulatory kinase/ATPase, partial [Candidatus Thermoplasmatota archaeon]|nr:RIO1 family regulatory kinase/ATPase [Candidatus Thermoplasmatota archaeon]
MAKRRRRVRGPRGVPLRGAGEEDDVVENVTHVPVEHGADPAALDVDDLEEDEPMLQLSHFASNDEWAFRQADRQSARLRTRTHDKDDRTEGGAFDARTMQVLHKMLIHGVIKSVDLPIAEGKEASVFRATTPRGGYLAIKIFRVNTATFHNFLQYIQGDERFEGITGDRRTMMKAWTHKEFRNLRRLRDVGVSVPEPIKAVENVLLMEYLGKKEGPWPQVREARMLDPEACYRALVEDL